MARKLSVTEWLLLINVIAYAILAIIGFSAVVLNEDVLVYVAQYNRFIFERGYVWELVTALFVHFHLGHLIGNVIFLLLFGYRAEDFFNWKQILVIYLLSGLAGNVLGLVMGLDFFSAGASGAVFGLFGSLIYPIKREEPKSLKSMILIGIVFLVLSGVNSNVDHISHWIGFLVGILIGKYFEEKNWRSKKEQLRKAKKIRVKKLR